MRKRNSEQATLSPRPLNDIQNLRETHDEIQCILIEEAHQSQPESEIASCIFNAFSNQEVESARAGLKITLLNFTLIAVRLFSHGIFNG